MRFVSTSAKTAGTVPLERALLQGLAPDGGLYLPTVLPRLPVHFLESLKGLPFPEIAFRIAQHFILPIDLAEEELEDLCYKVFNFSLPIVEVEEGILSLELYHGPTLSFKDFGARFMAALMGKLLKFKKRDMCILVATSGDTGSAVGDAFSGIEGIQVKILYPSGQISKLQEK